MRDKITIRDLEVFAYHGITDEEKSQGQKFLISLELYLDLRKAGKTDDLNYTIDYGEVCKVVTRHTQSRKYNLIETVAQSIAETLLLRYDDLLTEVCVSIKKPWAPIAHPVDVCGVTLSEKWHQAYIGIGSNLGDREAYLKAGIAALKENERCRVEKSSDIIESKPYGGVAKGDFLNMVIGIRTLLTPTELFTMCKSAELKSGRKSGERWGDRTLDMDILLYDDKIIDIREPELTIPHADMQNRSFVLEPLCQIAPGAVHPVLNTTIYQLNRQLQEKQINETGGLFNWFTGIAAGE